MSRKRNTGTFPGELTLNTAFIPETQQWVIAVVESGKTRMLLEAQQARSMGAALLTLAQEANEANLLRAKQRGAS